jgi:hypothetical protein
LPLRTQSGMPCCRRSEGRVCTESCIETGRPAPRGHGLLFRSAATGRRTTAGCRWRGCGNSRIRTSSRQGGSRRCRPSLCGRERAARQDCNHHSAAADLCLTPVLGSSVHLAFSLPPNIVGPAPQFALPSGHASTHPELGPAEHSRLLPRCHCSPQGKAGVNDLGFGLQPASDKRHSRLTKPTILQPRRRCTHAAGRVAGWIILPQGLLCWVSKWIF